ERNAFILGLVDTWEFRNQIQDPITGSLLLALGASGGFRTDELSRMITSIYSDMENIQLPIGWVALACLAIERGDTDKASVLTALRKQLSTALSKSSLEAKDLDPLPNAIFKHTP